MKTEEAGVKYKYAFANNLVIDIDSDLATQGRDYKCISCGEPMGAYKGVKQVHHFRHRKECINCLHETYLHKLAKYFFQQTYNNCLTNNIPYFIEYRVPANCHACKEHGPCCFENFSSKKVDLTQYFKYIDLEVRDSGFVPDIRLSNGKDSLFIEIAVTHFAEENKTGSEMRMVEIHIDNDQSDIDLIKSCRLSENDNRIIIFNFRRDPIDLNDLKYCNKSVGYFILHSSGKSVVKHMPVPSFESKPPSKIYVEEIHCLKNEDIPLVEGDGSLSSAFVDIVGKVFKNGMKVYNCWLCQSHCLRYRYYESFCRRHKSIIDNCNKAAECCEYRPIESVPECGLEEAAMIQAENFKEWIQRSHNKKTQAATIAAEFNVFQTAMPNKVTQAFGDQFRCEICGCMFASGSSWGHVNLSERTGVCEKCK